MLDRRQFVAGLGTMAVMGVAARSAWAAGSIKIDEASALLVIDVQNCFLPGGSLAVKDGDQVVPVINRLAKGFANVVLTQDWHTAGHVSFASVHSGKKPFETIDLPYGKQVLWPDHCVQGTEGAGLSKDLSIPQAGLIIRKGYHQNVDSYSAFTEADGKTTTGLAAYLNARKLQRLFIAGLPRISASHGRRWMRGRRDLRPMSSKMPAVASTRRAHSPRPGRTWRRRASNASSRAILLLESFPGRRLGLSSSRHGRA
jgi:nicotinamidase/pyrazinamidase